MAIATIAAVVAAAATVAGVASTIARGKPKPGDLGGQTSTLEFPEETRRLIGDIEFPQITAALGEQTNLLGGLLGGSGTNPFIQNQFGARSGQAAQSAFKRGAKDAGVQDLSGLDSLSALSPQLVEAIRSLTLQNAAQRTTVVPAGFGPFLSPSTFTATSTNSSPFDTGFQLAGSLASLGGAAYGAFSTPS